MEDERQKAETFLKSLSDLSQKICRLWPHGVVSVSAELYKHLDELTDGVNLLLGLPCSWKYEYKRKAGEVVVNSGLIAVLCEKATAWLEDKQGDDVTKVIWALYVCMGPLILLKKDGDLHRLLPLMVNLLKESFLDHMAGTLQQGGDETLIHSLGVLSGLARVEENKQHLRDLPNIQSVLRAYSRSENEWIYYYAVTTMVRLETERRADKVIFSPNLDMVKFFLGQLKALEREGFNPHDKKLEGVLEALIILTRNPGNSELLVQEGVLPYLKKGLVKCVSENKCKELSTCSHIVITLHNLTCEERNEAEIMKHTQVLDSLVSISIAQSHSHRPDCIEGAKDALSKLGMNPQDMQNDGTRRTDTRIDRDMETEALETTSVTPLSTTILKAEGKRPRHNRNPKGGASSQSKVSPSHAGGMLNQFQKSVQNCQPPFKVSRDSPCRGEVPSNPCKSPQQNSDTEQQNCTKKRHTCPCCPKDFISQGDLKAHLMQKKHFKCKKCEKPFSYKKTLAKHVKDKHDPDKESSYKCGVCDKEFGCARYMKEHQKVHGQYAHEMYKCKTCKKGFPYRSIRKKHIKLCR